MRKNPRTWRSQDLVIRVSETSERYQGLRQRPTLRNTEEGGTWLPPTDVYIWHGTQATPLAWQREKLESSTSPQGAVKTAWCKSQERMRRPHGQMTTGQGGRVWPHMWAAAASRLPGTQEHMGGHFGHTCQPSHGHPPECTQAPGLGAPLWSSTGSPSTLQLRRSLFTLRGSLFSSSYGF